MHLNSTRFATQRGHRATAIIVKRLFFPIVALTMLLITAGAFLSLGPHLQLQSSISPKRIPR